MSKLLRVLFWPLLWLLNFVFYRLLGISWSFPAWASALNQTRQSKPKAFWLSTLMLTSIIGATGSGIWYYYFVPKPAKIIATFHTPEVSYNQETIKPKPLIITFDYQQGEEFTRNHYIPDDAVSVAKIDQYNKVITRGIKMFPNRAGEWRWVGDNQIQFHPKQDWPADQEYSVSFSKDFFADHADLADLKYSFATPPFYVRADAFRLYKDPTQKNAHYLVTTLATSHPVDKRDLENQISLSIKQPNQMVTQTFHPDFELSYGLNDREVYLKSERIELPPYEQYAHLTVSPKIQSATGQATFGESIHKKVLLPNAANFLKVASTQVKIIRDESNEPEQILIVKFTDGVTPDEVKAHTDLFLLPKNKRGWNINKAKHLPRSERSSVEYALLENEQDVSSIYHFKLDVPENRYIYINVKQGLSSDSEYSLAKTYHEVKHVERYPRETKIMGEGSLLSLSGDQTLSLMVRGHSALKVTAHKLQDNQLNHLISQTGGDISDPYFVNYNFDKNNITVGYEKVIKLKDQHPKTLNYASLSLHEYLNDAGMGVFFIETQGWNLKHNRREYGKTDKRLIVITDLGVIVKKASRKNSQHVFVQSLKTSKPLSDAKVSVLGRNGVPVFTGKTNASGHVNIDDLSQLRRERQPTVFLVEHKQDRTFLPYDQGTRQINYSRFNIGGKTSQTNQPNKLSAFMFSDRGIYRPGETVQLASIVKDPNFKTTAGLPLQLYITNPKGKEVIKERLNLNKEGFFDYSFKTDITSPTGTYRASLYLLTKKGYIDYRLGDVNFDVEEFQPDTMKIRSRLEVGHKRPQGWINAPLITANIELTNLFGNPAQDRKVTANYRLSPTEFRFKKFAGYRFIDPLRDEHAQQRSVYERLKNTKTNAQGQADFKLDLSQYTKGSYELKFEAEGYEPDGGRSVSTSNRANVSPLSLMVGYKADGALNYLKKNQERTLSLVAVSPDLQLLPVEQLKLSLIKKQPVSTLVMANDGTYDYQSVIKHKLINEQDFQLSESTNELIVDTSTAGQYQLQLRDQQGELLTRVDYQVVAAGNMAGQLEKNAELQLALDKSDYKPGDWIEMNIVAPYAGSGLITIESDSVHAHKWFTSATNSTVERIQLPKGIEGNAYVNVAFIRDAKSPELFTSPLSYAVKSFNIDRSAREVDIDLTIPNVVRPGDVMNIGYSTNKDSKIIIFAVDQGILQVAGYQPPKPLDHFLAKKALQVDTFQMLDLILPEYKALLQHAGVGGGAARAMQLLGANLNPFQRTRDKPAVFWSGIQTAYSDHQDNVEFKVPDTFNGQLKVMAIAVSDDAIGATHQDGLVRGAFVLSPNVLNAATPGDEFDITLGVTNILEGSDEDAPIELALKTSDNLELIKGHQQTLNLSEGEEGKARYRVRVKTKSDDKNKRILGEGKLTFTATYKGQGKAESETATRTTTLSIRPASHYQTRVTTGYGKPPQTHELNRELFSEFGHKSLTASANPMVLAQGFMDYLDNYVHGCTEQIVSQVFPWVNLTAQPEFAHEYRGMNDKLNTLFQRLRNRQQADGGFSLWPYGGDSAHFPTLYATQLLSEAQFFGFDVPKDLLSNALDKVKEIARYSHPLSTHEDLVSARHRAYAIYLLTRNNTVTTSYLVDLHDALKASNVPWKDDITASYLAASYQLLKQPDEALKLIKLFDIDKYTNDRSSIPGETDYQTADTRIAQHLSLAYRYFPAPMYPELHKTLQSEETIQKLIDAPKHGRLNTINASYITLALNLYGAINRDRYGEDDITFEGRPSNIQTEIQPIFNEEAHFPNAEWPLATQAVTVKSSHPFFYQTVQTGFDRNLADKANYQGIEVYKEFYTEDGELIELSPINETGTDQSTESSKQSVHQGQTLTVKLKIRITSDKNISNMAVVDIQPGGFEILRDSVDRDHRHYVDIREDRINFYGTFSKGITELSYQVKATASGTFVIPSVHAEAMYDAKTFGYSASQSLIVGAQQQ